MTSTTDLFNERLNRIRTAVELRKPDRVPIVPLGDSFCANHLGEKVSDFCTIPKLSNEIMLKSFTSLGEVDGLQHVSFYVHMLSSIWLSKLKIPGRDLPDDELWQVDEVELMKIEDYDFIIEKGYNTFLGEYYMTRLDNLGEKLNPFLESFPGAIKATIDLGIVPFSPAIVTIPYENFCGGRSMVAFMRDLYRIPDKVQAAMDVAIEDIVNNTRQLLQTVKPIAIWVGGWRAASEFLAPHLWQRFVWPYYKRIIEVVVEEGVIPVLHFDSDWTRDLEYLRELPKAKCIFSPDGMTDIFKAKEILDGHMCIMGDVPAAMLTLGSPEEVSEYSKRLINEIGPSGFILAQGCDIPPNAKPENVKAMIDAVKL
ncbi:MAG: uroporphyrinogen-III decarboxylase [Desulfitibacter sp. BRH_c19]|nr:MAG: uroporphyrinogen-III decarboxylase [Desulfitibacter sp. BRH_c19]